MLAASSARRLKVAPRLREAAKLAGPQGRQRSGAGGRGGGESHTELDRRKIRDRIAELQQEINAMEVERKTQRARRQGRQSLAGVALVGYTNAGKSTLMRALTGSEVLVANKLFATLDTTVRVLYPESVPRVLVSDTVGFIKNLPHGLVASFKSTLDEALDALPFDEGVWRALTGALKEATGRKGKALFHPLRLALTSRDHGPEMAALLPLIGRDAALSRLRNAAR